MAHIPPAPEDYGVGYCSYKKRLGKDHGRLRQRIPELIFEKRSGIIVGVPIIGVLAAEIIHYGMAPVK